MRTYSSTLKVAACVTLAFYAWTFGPLFEIPTALAAESRKAPSVRSEGSTRTAEPRPQTAADRFEKALDDIRQKLRWAEDKSREGVEPAPEIEAIKSRKAEIESIDSELKAEFAATEKKLKDAHLPGEILERHHKFVKHYQDNLKELVANLEQVERAGTKAEVDTAVKKTREHLEKVKAQTKHIPLDPNKLPFRTVKAKERAPRQKKEEFERDFPQQRHQGTKTADSRLTTDFPPQRSPRTANGQWIKDAGFMIHDVFKPASWTMHRASVRKPILVASNGPLTGLLSSDPKPETLALPFSVNSVPSVANEVALNSELGTLNLALASPPDPPTADDLAETPEVQFTQDIQNLAAQLNHSPVKIFEWVKNNIEFVPTYGSIQGANMCLQTSQCNDMDTASLLVALLRVSNIPAHYVYGTIEVPMGKVMNWAGGFTDPNSAASAISSGGIPSAGKLSGGILSAIRMEHVWVEAYIPYGNYRGAIMDQSIKTWIPMDGSYKQYTYTNGFDMTATVPFSQDTYLSQVQSQNPVHYYQSQIQAYLDANMPDTSIVDVKGYRQITQEIYHFLPSTLPYVTVAVLGKYFAVPTGMVATATFTLSNPATGSNVSYIASTYDLAGKRVTVSYLSATSADEALIAFYGGFLYNVPAYMLNLVPVLKVEGAIQLTGEATTLGSGQNLTIQFAQPSGMNESINKNLIAGAYYAVGMDLQGVNENVLGKRNYNLTTNVLTQTAGTLGNDDLIGEHLHILATTYFLANDKIYKSGAKLYNTTITRTLSEGITSFTLSVSYLFGISKAATPSGINMDVAMDRVIVVAKDGNVSNETAYMNIAGLVSSYNEHDIFEKIDGFSSVSTVRALQVASANGIVIRKINSGNIAQILPTLQVGPDITTDIQNAVNAGKEVTIPQANVQINDWNGTGYIVRDPLTGSGTYMISGGLAGGDTTSQTDGMQVKEIFRTPLGWINDMLDLLTRNNIAEAAELNLGEIIQGVAEDLAGMGYTDIGQCVGLARVSYWAAGICLDMWSPWAPPGGVGSCGQNNLVTKNNISGSNGVSYHYNLANKLKISKSVRTTNDPLKGDIVFFNNTDKENHPLSHEGIVLSGPNASGMVRFMHSTRRQGVHPNQINLLLPTTSTYSNPANGNDYVGSYCPKGAGNPCLAAPLFAGYGTIRDTAPAQ